MEAVVINITSIAQDVEARIIMVLVVSHFHVQLVEDQMLDVEHVILWIHLTHVTHVHGLKLEELQQHVPRQVRYRIHVVVEQQNRRRFLHLVIIGLLVHHVVRRGYIVIGVVAHLRTLVTLVVITL